MPLPFAPGYFPSHVAWYAPASARPLSGGTPVPARVGPVNTAARQEAHYQPEGTQSYYVETPADPGVSVDWLATWNGRTFRVKTAPAADDVFVLWRTECVEVS